MWNQVWHQRTKINIRVAFSRWNLREKCLQSNTEVAHFLQSSYYIRSVWLQINAWQLGLTWKHDHGHNAILAKYIDCNLFHICFQTTRCFKILHSGPLNSETLTLNHLFNCYFVICYEQKIWVWCLYLLFLTFITTWKFSLKLTELGKSCDYTQITALL